MKIRFLIDENLSPKLKKAVLHLNPDIDILRVGDPSTPPLGTLDPEILQYKVKRWVGAKHSDTNIYAFYPDLSPECESPYISFLFAT